MMTRKLLLITALTLGGLGLVGFSTLAKSASFLNGTTPAEASSVPQSTPRNSDSEPISEIAQVETVSEEVRNLLNQAQGARFDQEYDQAVTLYREILLKPIPEHTRGQVNLNLGEILSEQQKYSEAIAAYEAVVAIYPKLMDAWIGHINALIQLNEIDAAKRLVADVRQYLPEEVGSLDQLGYYSSLSEIYRDLDDFNQSITLMGKALKLNPYVTNAAGCDLTIEGLKHIGIRAGGTKWQYRAARCNLSLIETQEGPIESWSAVKPLIYDAVDQQNVYNDAYQRTGLKVLTSVIPHELFQPDTPTDRWEEATAISSLNLGIGFLNRAITMGHSPSMEAAILFLRTSVKNDTSYGWNHIYLSSALLAQGRPDDAILSIEEALALPNLEGLEPSKSWVWAHNNRGYALELQGKQDEATRAYEQAIALDPSFTTAKENLQRISVGE